MTWFFFTFIVWAATGEPVADLRFYFPTEAQCRAARESLISPFPPHVFLGADPVGRGYSVTICHPGEFPR